MTKTIVKKTISSFRRAIYQKNFLVAYRMLDFDFGVDVNHLLETIAMERGIEF